MKAVRRGLRRLVGAITRSRHDCDFAEEIKMHIDMQTDDNLKLGLPPEEARRMAVLKFGGIESARESYRDQLGFRLIDNMRLDVRAALRMLRNTPSLSVPVILVLALGIGAATALYSFVYALWLRPLPYPEASRLVSVTTYFANRKVDTLLSPDYAAWQGTKSLGPLAAYNSVTESLVLPEETLEVECFQISGNFLNILRIHQAAGRDIQPADDAPGKPAVVMLSDRLWRERFGADNHAIGASIQINGTARTIVGVLPPGFRMPDERRADLLTPLALQEGWFKRGSSMKMLRGVARLEPGATTARAQAELLPRLSGSRAQQPQLYGEDTSLRVIPLNEYAVRDVRATAVVLLGATIGILLIAGANVAGILVARAAGLSREMTTRVALGATRLQIVRHLLAEGFVLAAIGIFGGLMLARALVTWLSQLIPAILVHNESIAINGPVLVAALFAALLCTLASSLAPVLPLSRLRTRRALVVAELALSLMLMTAAALLLENLVRPRRNSTGFRIEQLVTGSISLRGTRFAKNSGELRREISERLEGIPGIVILGYANALPPSDASRITPFNRSDRSIPSPSPEIPDVIVRLVDGSFFETMGTMLHSGRLFTEEDKVGEGLVAVVNRTLADRYFAGESPLGKKVDGDGVPWKTIVGVVGDTRNDGLQNPTRPEIYLPWTESNMRGGGWTSDNGLNMVLRTSGDPAAAVSMLRANLHTIDRGLLAKIGTMDEKLSELRKAPQLYAAIFSGFAALALAMASAGIYGVLSHIVVLRRREIGIRVALGARPRVIRSMFLREALALAAGGVIIGVGGALVGSRFLGSLLYQVNPRDPLTLLAMAVLLIIMALCASAAPALRASRQDPAETLRAE